MQMQVFEPDISFSTNTVMKIKIKSLGFCGVAKLDIDIKEFARFVADIQKVYTSLNGRAKIEEPYGIHQYIEFSGDGKGHILVEGLVSQRFGDCNQELKFSNEIDQTQLKDFTKELCENTQNINSNTVVSQAETAEENERYRFDALAIAVFRNTNCYYIISH